MSEKETEDGPQAAEARAQLSAVADLAGALVGAAAETWLADEDARSTLGGEVSVLVAARVLQTVVDKAMREMLGERRYKHATEMADLMASRFDCAAIMTRVPEGTGGAVRCTHMNKGGSKPS